MIFGLYAIGVMVGLQVQLDQKEYMDFCEKQYNSASHIPDRSQYFEAKYITYLIDNPPPPPYFKTKLARLINWMADKI